MADGLVIAAPRSGSGKTIVTLGLVAALRARGLAIAPAKTGPDYIDTKILARTAGADAINLDPWAMSPARLRTLAARHAAAADLLVVEGVMGLFDGAADGTGSTADLAAALGLPVILVVDAEKQCTVDRRPRSRLRHLASRCACRRPHRQPRRHHPARSRCCAPRLRATGIPILGVLPRRDTLVLPERHLGLVLPDEVSHFETVISSAAEAIAEYIDLDRLLALSHAPPSPLRGGAGGGGRAAATESHPPAFPQSVLLPSVGEGGRRSDEGGSQSAPPPRLPPLGTPHRHRPRRRLRLPLHPLARTTGTRPGAEHQLLLPARRRSTQPPTPMPSSSPAAIPSSMPRRLAARRRSSWLRPADCRRPRRAASTASAGAIMVLGQTLTDKAGATWPMAGLLPHVDPHRPPEARPRLPPPDPGEPAAVA
ncbi:MAG: AAA family ATPase [Candidatus Promineifilaceae bacterium]